MEAALQSTTFASRVCFSSLVPAHFSQSPSGNSARRALSTRKYGSRNPAWQVSPVCLAVSDGVSTVQERTNAQESPSEAPRPDLSSKLGAVVTDAAVPEGHKGLHGFLYGEAGADVHDGEAAFQVRAREDDGSTVVELEHWLQGRENERPPGVYAIYDKSGVLQYIGYSRNLVLTLKQHRQRVGEERTAGVRVKVYTNSALVSRARLEEERQAWVAQQTLPAGNGAERDLWEGTGPATAVMTEAERGAYEEKKLKMRKAMGENLYDDVEGEDADSRTRRLRLLQAVEGDDWSGVIDGQTQETLTDPQAERAAAAAAAIEATKAAVAAKPQIVSPFARANAPSVGAPVEAAAVLMSVESVDRVLDQVRPYLIADGGNVEVVGVENGIVALRLQGACGTCPSSTATMQMGIEAALKAHFGEALQQVVQVDKLDIGATLESVNSHLDILRPAITNYGGSVEVLAVDTRKGTAEVRYKGPAPIGMGIQAAIKDKFPDIKKVNLVD